MHDITKDADLWTHATKQHVCYKMMILSFFPVAMIIHTVPSRKLTLKQRWATKCDATLQIVSTCVSQTDVGLFEFFMPVIIFFENNSTMHFYILKQSY